MNWLRLKNYFLSLCVALFALGAVHTPAMAQEGSGTGEVRRLDHDNQKITLKHGAISELDLPAITLVYLIETSRMEGLAPGNSDRFTARRSDAGGYVIIRTRTRETAHRRPAQRAG